MIELHNLTIANDASCLLLENQSLTLPKGTLTALIGRNGCGKSTLLRTLCGLQRQLSGYVSISGMNVAEISPRSLAERVAVVSTETVKIDNLTCRELVSFARSPYTGLLGRLSADDNCVVDEALAAVGMTEFATRQVAKLSDGETRRILIARALAQQTPVILLDEPTSFLDVPGRYEISNLLARLAHSQGKTILYSTHELEPAFINADTILLMTDRQLLALPPSEMRTHSAYKALFCF